MIERLEKEVDMVDRHLMVLRMVIEHEPIGIATLATRTGYPNHKVRYSLRVLEAENLITASRQGAITTDVIADGVTDLDTTFDDLFEKLDEMKLDKRFEIEL